MDVLEEKIKENIAKKHMERFHSIIIFPPYKTVIFYHFKY
ncbi:hypothetical protein bcere0013_52800 [Bacillus cereus BDRD-ST26]|nr:hypothetical protein bcere0013_52800 [Bacillus cereus BDRD-ST26]